jgi:hypothetical protein
MVGGELGIGVLVGGMGVKVSVGWGKNVLHDEIRIVRVARARFKIRIFENISIGLICSSLLSCFSQVMYHCGEIAEINKNKRQETKNSIQGI